MGNKGTDSSHGLSGGAEALAGLELLGRVERLQSLNEALAAENARLRGEAEVRARHLASFPLLNPNPILEVDTGGGVLFFNPAAKAVLESLGLSPGNAGPFLPADLAAVAAGLRAKRRDAATREVSLGGRTFVEHLYLAPGDESIRIYAYEITEKAQHEVQLNKSVRRLELLAATAGELLQAKEPQQAVEALCARVLEYLGCHVFFNYLVDEAAGGLRLNACAGIPAAEASRIACLDFGVAVCGCVARDGRRIVAERVQSTPDERTALVRSYGVRAYACHPLLGPGGAVLGTLSFGTRGRDCFDEEELSLMKTVTDLVATAMTRLRDTRALRESKEQVERNLAELATVNADLEAFVYSVSHDLSEPARAVSGFAQLTLAQQAGRLDARGADYLRRIERGAARMNRLIEDLLDLSRISRQPIERVEVDLSAIAAACLAELREADPGRGVETAIAPGLTAVADRGLVTIALSNLLDNAWKFTSRSGPARIRFGTGVRAGRREFFVQDNGVGFDPAYTAQLFQPFHRLHAGREFPGTGVGLALVERAVRRHGGQVRAEGRPGAGAAIFFTLDDSVRCQKS